MRKAEDHSRTWKRKIKGLIWTHPVCQVRMWWGLLGGVAPISLDGVELLWLWGKAAVCRWCRKDASDTSQVKELLSRDAGCDPLQGHGGQIFTPYTHASPPHHGTTPSSVKLTWDLRSPLCHWKVATGMVSASTVAKNLTAHRPLR